VSPDVAAPVRQRLLNHARSAGRPFNEVLQHFVLERFLYRLGRSPYRDRFVLKGALMFTAWQSPVTRSTRDIDLLGRMGDTVEEVVSAIRAICQEPAPDDGLRFDADQIAGERIVAAAEHAGVRVRTTAYLGKARIPLRIDVGFGDPVVPGPSLVSLPAQLGFPQPEVQGYSRESVVAEKLQVMVYLGQINSRMKDFYDIWLLATEYPFDGAVLAQAVRETFDRRQTALPSDPVAFTDAFARDPAKEMQWRAFVERHRLEGAPGTLHETVRVLSPFLVPVIRALSQDQPFDRHWSAGGPWA
jgi:predicted nucleotidyltransferase component of viral defense system